ncbi:peptidase domain-containing ABC transporter [Desulfogranum mediterraneum]|uniref:peptidase domain-containing ABC transporter n=1 Tax=Desulfogranum mediterraneum TaxID=160661 RepID=UPI001ABFDD7E|nr:peptidase domain-containing ABC transporter [Desulfogranum mediterraneum]
MTQMTKVDEPDHAQGLLDSCRRLAMQSGWQGLVDELDLIPGVPHLENSKQTLEKITRAGRASGFKTLIVRPQAEQLAAMTDQFPVVAELRDGSYVLLSEIAGSSQGAAPEVRILRNGADGSWEEGRLSAPRFFKLWSGGILLFQKINTALVCFSLVAKEHKIDLTDERLRHEFHLNEDEIPQQRFLRMAKEVGLKARLLSLNWKELAKLGKGYPAVAVLTNGRHLVLAGMAPGQGEQQDELLIGCYDPLAGMGGAHIRLTRQEFEEIWSGRAYVIKRPYRLTDENQPFSLRWFIPEILRQKVTFLDIALAVLFINLISLVTPIFFQIVIDKVLVNQAFTTLHVLGISMTAALLVNAGLDFLRDYLLLHATNKIDLRVTGRTFRHLLQLPLGFFEHLAAGVLTQHMQQTSKIRNFLTGNVFLTILEATSLFVFLPFLFFYSLRLTGIVLLFTTLIGLVIGSLIVPFKRRLDALYEAEGSRQAMLVETINGMATVKAMAIEPLLRKQWENKVAKAVSMQFRVGKISITAKSLTQLLERLMTVILIWLGAGLVFNGSLTVGALIAFQMLAGRVTSPLVRLVGLIHQYQEAALSVEKLGVVMNARPEWGADRHGARPALNGDIVFERVRFRYAPDLPDALREISLTIPANKTLGIVGPSGSGKTTLTRMLQKVYFPSAGTIRISNCYLNEIDTAHLRQNMGVVLQESFLFNATVAENIRAGQAKAGREEIIQAALQAGADEFIVKLSQGYDTKLEEGAKNLSGGQRQRLAIARALLTRPQILILDEATSSLDPESERIIRNNLVEIARNRTVVIVSHRLSMLKDADMIIVLEDGCLVGHGAHEQLLKGCSLYHHLWQQQMEV